MQQPLVDYSYVPWHVPKLLRASHFLIIPSCLHLEGHNFTIYLRQQNSPWSSHSCLSEMSSVTVGLLYKNWHKVQNVQQLPIECLKFYSGWLLWATAPFFALLMNLLPTVLKRWAKCLYGAPLLTNLLQEEGASWNVHIYLCMARDLDPNVLGHK